MSTSNFPKELNFAVQPTNVEYTAGKAQLLTKDYKVIYRTDTKECMGVKKVISIDPGNPRAFKDVLIFQYQEAYELAQKLYQLTFGQEADCFKHYASENQNWAAMFFNAPINLDEFIFGRYNSGNQLKELEQLSLNPATDHHSFRKFEPIIGVSNGFDYEDDIKFHLIISISEGQRKSLLTISDYKISPKKQKELLETEDSKVRFAKVVNLLEAEATHKFLIAIKDFVHYYDSFSRIDIGSSFLTPICLDIFDKNRSKRSIENDEKLRHSISRLQDESTDYFYSNRKENLSAIVDFIMYSNLFDLADTTLNRDKIEEMFVQKKAYKKSVAVFPKFVHRSRLEAYAHEQKSTLDDIQPLLRRRV